MKRKFLEDLGLDAEVINKIMAEHGSTIQELQASVTDLTADRDTLKVELEAKKGELTTLEKSLNAKTKDYDTLKDENDKSAKLLTQYQNKDVLIGLGVDSKYIDFVSHEVSSKRGEAEFKDYAEAFIKDNAQYKTGNTQRINTQIDLGGGSPTQSSGNEAINKSIREASGRQ